MQNPVSLYESQLESACQPAQYSGICSLIFEALTVGYVCRGNLRNNDERFGNRLIVIAEFWKPFDHQFHPSLVQLTTMCSVMPVNEL